MSGRAVARSFPSRTAFRNDVVIFQTNHGLAARQGGQRCADGSNRFDQAGMHSAVDDSIGLPVVGSDLQFRHNFISGGRDEVNSHGLVPAAARVR